MNNLNKNQFKNNLAPPTAFNSTNMKLDDSPNNINKNIMKIQMMNKGIKIDNQLNNNNFNNNNNSNNNINNFNNNNFNNNNNSNNNIFNNFNNNNFNNNNFNNNNFNNNNFNNNNFNNNNFNNNNFINNNNFNNSIPNMNPYLNDIYFKLSQRNFTTPPNFKNSLTIESLNISNENRQIINQILKSVKIILITPLEILYKEQYDLSHKTSKERDKCPICLCEFYDNIIPDNNNIYPLKPLSEYLKQEIDVVKLYKCEDHFYHIECLNNLIKDKQGGGFKCAMCQKIYGILEGSMPPGTMNVHISKSHKCSGFKVNTIVIDYNIPSGKLPNGHYFSGTSRRAYLPNNKEGREILALLKIAFDRKLTFVVGTSVTTGQKNTVVWNGIHHKTSLYGGTQSYGYPDPTYFNRVKEELAAKGVSAEDFTPSQLEQMAKNLLNGY